MIFRISRKPPGESDPYLQWKVRLFMLGAVIAAAGMTTEISWLVWAGVAVLAVGLGLRFLPKRSDENQQDGP